MDGHAYLWVLSVIDKCRSMGRPHLQQGIFPVMQRPNDGHFVGVPFTIFNMGPLVFHQDKRVRKECSHLRPLHRRSPQLTCDTYSIQDV